MPKSESMQDVSISTGIVEAAAEGDGVVVALGESEREADGAATGGDVGRDCRVELVHALSDEQGLRHDRADSSGSR